VIDESPREKLDWFVDGAIKSVRSIGAEPNVENITRDTAAALSEMDRAIAAGDIVHTKDAKPTTPKPKEQYQAEALAAAAGGEFRTRELPAADAVKPLPVLTGVDLARHVALMKRVKALCARSTKRRLQYGRDGIMDADFEYPAFAREIVEETMAMNTGTFSPGAKVSYGLLSKADRDRVYFAVLERICDRSSAVIGCGWWIKH
jgi:hypothetical protein